MIRAVRPAVLRPVALAALLLAGPACAQASVAAPTPTRVGVDERAQVAFSLTGRDLTVTLRPVGGADNPLLADLSGAKAVALCRGRRPSTKRAAIAERQLIWAPGALTQTIRLDRNVSLKPQWCVLERPNGVDFAATLKLRIPRPTA